MPFHAILQPVVVLVGWSLVMLVWMLATRLPAMKAAGVDLHALVGSTAADAERGLPARAQWKAHNYNHLMEQPTLFYAIVGVLAIAGIADAATVALAWGYALLRIAHSLSQATTNRVRTRFTFFTLSSLCLIALTLRAALAVFA